MSVCQHEKPKGNEQFATPILFLVFNRPELTEQVFAAIRAIKPATLYIASDGPRATEPEDSELVRRVREYILEHIDWQCQIKTLFREDNAGCKTAVSEAITWFFEHEEMGIILEDDCLPNKSFFYFCEQLLLQYRNDMRVWHIGGNNFGFRPAGKELNSHYCFIPYPQVWGWATWRSRWQHYTQQLNLREFAAMGENIKTGTDLTDAEFKIYYDKIAGAFSGRIDTWDYQWHATVLSNHGLCAVPRHNLISNLGDGEGATHTKNDRARTRLATAELDFPLRHPAFFLYDAAMSAHFRRHLGLKRSMLMKIRIVLSLVRRGLTCLIPGRGTAADSSLSAHHQKHGKRQTTAPDNTCRGEQPPQKLW